VVGTTRILDHGPASQRWNLVIMGDGYQASQLGQFAADAQRFVDTLVATPPFDGLHLALNVFRVDVTSTDSGADDPVSCGGTGILARTYFDASFCSRPNIQRALAVNNATALAVATAQVPQFHMAMVIVNSTVYGGTGGAVATFSLASGATEIGLHEMGHTAFGFADEYAYLVGCGAETDHDNHPPGEPAQPNVTLDANRATNKWRDLVAAATPMPTTRNAACTKCDPQASPVPAGTVGAFEGADLFHCGAFRPEFTCRMQALNNPFCTVCQRVIRRKLSPFLPPPLHFAGSPAAVSWGPGRLDFFAIGTDGAMYQRAWVDDHFGDWVNLGGHFTGSPAAVSWGPGRLDFFAIGTDGAMYQRAWVDDHFGDWVNLSNPVTSRELMALTGHVGGTVPQHPRVNNE
jgi:hypothetical protein